MLWPLLDVRDLVRQYARQLGRVICRSITPRFTYTYPPGIAKRHHVRIHDEELVAETSLRIRSPLRQRVPSEFMYRFSVASSTIGSCRFTSVAYCAPISTSAGGNRAAGG